MKTLAALLLSLAVVSSLTGCASITAAPGEAGPAATDLVFGIRAIGGVNGAGWADEARKRQITLVNVFSEADATNVDVVMRAALVKRGTRVSLETVSARTGETLTEAEIPYFWVPTSWRETIEHLAVNFKKGTPLYEKIAAERDAAKPAASGVSKAELERIVKSAVAGAAASPAAEAPKSFAADAPSFRSPERPDDLAVIIGVESYSDIATKAPYAERDADAFKAYVRALGVPERNIVLLKGSKAGKAAFEKNVEQWLPRMAKPESRLYFYFSGHGAPDVKTGQAYLVPWDGDPNFLETTAYPVARLYEKLGTLPSKRVLVAMDSCFSGAGGRSVLASGARPLVTKVATAPVPDRLTVLSASAANEISGSLDDKGHGAFTWFLLKGLDAGKATPRALAEFVVPRVQDEARRLNRDQTPQLSGDGSWSLR
ncbi:MAG: caspase family protein [Elusimicrobia bacterium]|nr:caspase family protein [Elusimicrobiota bacterium]